MKTILKSLFIFGIIILTTACGDSPTTTSVTNNNDTTVETGQDKECTTEKYTQEDGDILINTICDGEIVKSEEIYVNEVSDPE